MHISNMSHHALPLQTLPVNCIAVIRLLEIQFSQQFCRSTQQSPSAHISAVLLQLFQTCRNSMPLISHPNSMFLWSSNRAYLANNISNRFRTRLSPMLLSSNFFLPATIFHLLSQLIFAFCLFAERLQVDRAGRRQRRRTKSRIGA